MTKGIDVGLRAQIITLREIGWTNDAVADYLHVSPRVVTKWYSIARARGYDPAVSKQLKDEWLKDKPRPGRRGGRVQGETDKDTPSA